MAFIQSSFHNVTSVEIPAAYDTDDDYIECLAYGEMGYTSDTINDDVRRIRNQQGLIRPRDPRVPFMLRCTAESPYKGTQCIDVGGEVHDILSHASALIPASNGAFWVVYPFHCDTLNIQGQQERESRSSMSRQAVQYYMPNESGTGYTMITGADGGEFYQEFFGTWSNYTEATDDALSKKHLVGGHPCGAAYLNMTLPIDYIDGDTFKRFTRQNVEQKVEGVDKPDDNVWKSDSTEREFLRRFFCQSGIQIDKNGTPCIDVLVCYGGYHWLRGEPGNPESRKLWCARDGSVRFYVPTPRINCTIHEGLGGYITTLDVVRDPQRIVWQTIVPGNVRPYDWAVFSLPNVPIGASLVALDPHHSFRAVGGIQLKGAGRAYTYVTQTGARNDAYLWSEYKLSAGIYSVKTKVLSEQEKNYVYTLFVSVHFTDIVTSTETKWWWNNQYACFNPMSRLTYGVGASKLHTNDAPMMYPSTYAVDGCLVAYGAEWIGDRNHDLDITQTLRNVFESIFSPDVASYQSPVCHIPLVNNQYLCRPKGSANMSAYPLNVSGALGMCEGALIIPNKDGTTLSVVGGCVSEYSEHSYSYRDYAVEDQKLQYVPTYDAIACLICPTYSPEKIHLLPLCSYIITPKTASWAEPYSIGADTLKYDCLFSQCIQIPETDYFVAPSSYFQYSENGDSRPNMTLLKRVEPLSINDPKLKGMSEKEALDAITLRVRVSEIVGLKVDMETSETYADETPCHYGRASAAKHSIGIVQDADGVGYWLYRLGNGSKPADYHHITLLKSAQSLWKDVLNATAFKAEEEKTPGHPDEWRGA